MYVKSSGCYHTFIKNKIRARTWQKTISRSLIFHSKQLEKTPVTTPGDRLNTQLCIHGIKYTGHPHSKHHAVIRKNEEALPGHWQGERSDLLNETVNERKRKRIYSFCYSGTLGADTRKRWSGCHLCERAHWCDGVPAGSGESKFPTVLLSSLNRRMWDLCFKKKQIKTKEPFWILSHPPEQYRLPLTFVSSTICLSIFNLAKG